MKTYHAAIERLGLTGICLGAYMQGEIGAPTGCGIRERSHRTGFIFLDVVHFNERRVTRRGLRKLLLLVAKRDRLVHPGFLNDPGLWFLHFYLDERWANEQAARLGVRFPVKYSAPERRSVSLVPGLSRRYPAIWAWARRAA